MPKRNSEGPKEAKVALAVLIPTMFDTLTSLCTLFKTLHR